MSRGTKNSKQKVVHEKKLCTKCLKDKRIDLNYYKSLSDQHADERYPTCKECLKAGLPDFETAYDEYTEKTKEILQQMNRPFLSELWNSTVVKNKGKDIFGIYMKNIQMPQYAELRWKNSTFTSSKIDTQNNDDNTINEPTQYLEYQESQNEIDVKKMLGYDPFENENPTDKRHLFNKLVDFLDESTLEDSFKLPAVIEIVKTFNQLDKINAALSTITSDAKQLASNVGAVNSLITAKEKMLKAALALARDNGISVNHNNNKSKGAGTLSGIIKSLHEKGIGSAEINIYDIETSEGMRQVADISNRSILDQLMLNENDYSEMIKEQRELINSLNIKVQELEENNRLLKIKIKQVEGE